jgi:MEDS: MEthanogen/methylotroph, DcmR Sensory domain
MEREGLLPAAVKMGGAALAVHDHVCLAYDSGQERDRMIVELLVEGLRAGHRCLCLAAASDQLAISARVAEQGEVAVEFDEGQREGRLEFVDPAHSYLRGGRFSSGQMGQFWADWAVAISDRRRGNTRIVADMSWAQAFLAPDFVDDLVRYEAQFDLWNQAHTQETVCLYDTGRFPDDLILRLSKVHSQLLIDGEATPNPFHVDPARILAYER